MLVNARPGKLRRKTLATGTNDDAMERLRKIGATALLRAGRFLAFAGLIRYDPK